MKRASPALAFAIVCLCGCARQRTLPVDAAAERYVRLALAVGARDPDSLDYYAGPPAWRVDAQRAYRSLPEIRADLLALDRDLAAADGDEGRRAFLARQTAALVSRIDLLRGARPRFDDEARQLFGVRLEPGDDRQVAAARADLIRRLPPERGDLRSRYLAYRRAHVVAPDRVKPAFEQALAACRDRTRAHLALPGDERVVVEYAATRSPWPAFTRYTGAHRSVIQVNTAFAFTDDDLVDLACHEAYPGHHTAYVLQDDALVKEKRRIEFTVAPLFSPQAFLSEATAAYAPTLAYPERAGGMSALVDALDPVRLDIARRYLDGDLEFARAAAALEQQTLVPDAAPALKFLNEFRSYIVTDTAGRRIVARIVERAGAGEARWRTYEQLLLAGALP